MAATTWDTTYNNTKFTYTNSNLTASIVAGNTSDQHTRATNALGSGYWECTIGAIGGNTVCAGFDNGSLATTDFVGKGGNGVGWQSNGSVFPVALGITLPTYTTGDVLSFCLKSGKIYFAKNGVWALSADPSAGTGGVTCTTQIPTTAYPAVSTNNAGSVFTGAWASGSMAYTVPTGVTAWDGAGGGSNNISGSSTLTFAPSATLLGTGTVTGSSTLTFAPSATLLGAGAVSGTSALTFAPSGTLLGKGAIVGSSTITFSASLTAPGATGISGTAALTFTPSATLLGTGQIAGSASMTFTLSGGITLPVTNNPTAISTTVRFSPGNVRQSWGSASNRSGFRPGRIPRN